MRLKIFFATMALVSVALSWTVVRSRGAKLDAELFAARDRQNELAKLSAERDRLRAQQPNPAQLAADRSAVAEATQIRHTLEQYEAVSRPAPFAVGEWMPAAGWSNRGAANPRGAIETALWAAAGGDVATLSALLELDPVARAKADALLAQLPVTARQNFANAEALIASATIGHIPLAEAQIAWFHASDDDHASAALLLHGTEHLPPASVAPPGLDPTGEPPPAARENPNPGTRMTTITLHRSNAGWRLVVPDSAIDRMGRDLLATAK